MSVAGQSKKIFKLDFHVEGTIRRKLFYFLRKPLEKILFFRSLNKIYQKTVLDESDGAFYDKLIRYMNVNYRVSERDKARIPRNGKVIVVANHPFGGIEGIILASLMRGARNDSKILANYILERIPELREVFFFVNPFGTRKAIRYNLSSMKKSLEWVKDGHALGIFPAGEVAHFSLGKRKIMESAWDKSVAGLIRKTEAPVLPVYFDGFNGPLFHMLGLIHPRLRTMLLPKEFVNKQNKNIDICIGNLIQYNKLNSFESDKEMMTYLKQRTFMLQNRTGEDDDQDPANLPSSSDEKMEPVISPMPSEVIAKEVDSINQTQQLVKNKEFEVYYANQSQIPVILQEIGRLREITFRGANEGTGKSIDLDDFDNHYDHLFVWNREKKEVIGAYRIGRTDQIIRDHGKKGVYTTTLFNIKSSFFNEINPALEMGRSFVRPEYQRSFAPLLLLWRGIGEYVVKYPDYKILFGPVSISSEYHSMSRHLMVTFLKMHNYLPEMARFIRPVTPYRGRRMKGIDPKNRTMISSIEDVSELVSEFERDKKGVPILLKQYLKLGGKLLGFNVDPDFSDVLDGLILVDLTKADTRILKRYMGDEGVVSFLEHHKKEKEETVA